MTGSQQDPSAAAPPPNPSAFGQPSPSSSQGDGGDEGRPSPGDSRRGLVGWWCSQTAATQFAILTLVAIPLFLTLVQTPLAPFLNSLGERINFLEDEEEVDVRVVAEAAAQGVEDGWIAPDKGKSDISRDDYTKTLTQWEADGAAVAAREQVVLLNVQGTSAIPVMITRLEIDSDCSRPAATGTLFRLTGGDGLPARYFDVDLSAAGGPVVVPYAGESGNPKPVGFPYKVSRSMVEQFQIRAHTSRGECQWTGTLHWTAEGKAGTTSITRKGNPFRLTADDAATGRVELGDFQ